MLQDTMLLHRICVTIQDRLEEIQVDTEKKLICISRHASTRHAVGNVVFEIQVIAVEMRVNVTDIQVVFVKIQVKIIEQTLRRRYVCCENDLQLHIVDIL